MTQQYRRTAANVDLDAIAANIRGVRGLVGPKVKVMAIIKADAYGHGAIECARRLDSEEGLTDAYGVAIVEEGEALRAAGVTKPILILGYTAPEQLERVINAGLIQTVFTLEAAEALSRISVMKGTAAEVHIKLDTGMGRIGFVPSKEAMEDILNIAKLPGIKITGIFSHFARADEYDKAYAKEQFRKYSEFVNKLEAAGLNFKTKHIANSAAIMEMPETYMDMVRSGIITYGMYPSDEVDRSRLKLKPALSWTAHVSYVKEVPAGTCISYGGTFTASHTMRIATIPIGYADGYPRSLSNKGKVLIRGQHAPILGRICMDQFMVDVTEIPGVCTGDVVTLVGHDGGAAISIEEVAQMSGSFNYEFACDISKRVERVYLRDAE